MPWYLDEIARSNELDWHFVDDQNLPDRLSLPTVIPDKSCWPIRMVLHSAQSRIPDFAVGPSVGILIVSARFRDLLESFEPLQHHFIPVEISCPDGDTLKGTHFMFKLGSWIENGIIVQESDVKQHYLRGKFTRYLATSQAPRLVWDFAAIAGRHIWADRHFARAINVSDELYEELQARKMGTFLAIESRINVGENR